MIQSSWRERSSRRRLSLILLLIGVAGVAAFGLPWVLSGGAGGDDATAAGGGSAAAGPAPPRQLSGPTVRWDGGLLEPGEPERVTIYFIGGSREGDPVGPCSPAYAAAVLPSPDVVKITLHTLPTESLPEGHGCARIGYQRSLVVPLPEPLRGRAVVDGATGERQELFDARLSLDPTYLPDGYRPARDEAGVMEPRGVFRRSWLRDVRPGKQAYLEVVLGDADLARRPTYREVILARPTVRGVAAKVYKSEGFDDSICVTWAEGELGRRVCTLGDPSDLLPVAELIRFADGLRPRGG
jgi:hypothetical protein